MVFLWKIERIMSTNNINILGIAKKKLTVVEHFGTCFLKVNDGWIRLSVNQNLRV